MRCKKHPADLSSRVGVCASCLRERLFSLIAAQAEEQARAQAQARLAACAEDRRKSDTHPPPLVFPRSVSPYVCRRKSDDDACRGQLYDRRFYSTPQVGPTYNSTGSVATFDLLKKKKESKFSLVRSLFRSRSDTSESDPRVSTGPTTTSPSQSWFGSIFSGRRKKQSRLFDESNAGVRRVGRRDRGMSPAREANEEEDYDLSPSASGYSSESSQGWRRTPMAAAPATRRGRSNHGRNVSGLAFCMSPLVRASPNRHWNQKGMPPEIGISGDVRVSAKPHLSTAASFCANRSRKLADFGRFNHNH